MSSADWRLTTANIDCRHSKNKPPINKLLLRLPESPHLMSYASSSQSQHYHSRAETQNLQDSSPAIVRCLRRRAILQSAAGLPALLAGLPSAAHANKLALDGTSTGTSSIHRIQDAYDSYSSECPLFCCISPGISPRLIWARHFCRA